jgi:aminopeptidase N
VLILVLMLQLAGDVVGAEAEIVPGVGRSLAKQRVEQFRDVHYDLFFRIPEDVSAPIFAELNLTFSAAHADAPLVLDFEVPDPRVSKFELNGERIEPELKSGHIVVPASALRIGNNHVHLSFVAGDGPLNRNEDFMYTLFVPDRAGTCFPCFDQPDMKARFSLKLDVPEGWAVTEFEEERAISTYLFAFAAGRFLVAEQGGVRVLHRETDEAKLARNLPVIFVQHQQAIAWMEEYTEIPLPFRPFDIVLIPGFQYGGMEHVGHVFYRAESLLLDPSATELQALARAGVIAHETAHMWFGNLVTMSWFNDVWLKEVFANFMAARIVHPHFRGIDHELRFLLRHYPGAFEVDRTEGANPVIQELDNLNQAGNIYGAIIYLKAPIGMRELERMMGAAAFQAGLRQYLKTYAYGNATWKNLVDVLQQHTPHDLRAFSTSWFEQAGMPELDALNNSFAYGVAPEARSVDQEASALVRARSWLNVWELTVAGKIPPSELMDLILARLPVEPDSQIVAVQLSYLEELFWRYMKPEQRRGIAPKLEKVLEALLTTREEPRIVRAAYRTMVRTASSERAIERLREIWEGQQSPYGFPLTETDFSVLACELAVRGVDVTTQQLARIENADRRARFSFILPALAQDVPTRDDFFQRVCRAENRTREPWVVSALRYLHHPLRNEAGLRYLAPSLGLLDELQRTGDIFFPKAWLDASFSGYQSPEAVEIIRKYIAENPTLSQPLRQKLLQAADPVFRAAHVLYP